MRSWLKGKYSSVQLRILFTFWLVLMVLLLGIGAFLDNFLSNTQTQYIEQHFQNQSNLFRSCQGGQHLASTTKLSHCSHIFNQISRDSNYLLFNAQGALIWEVRQYPSQLDYPKALPEKKIGLALEHLAFIRLNDSFITNVALNNQEVLVLSTAAESFDAIVFRNRVYLASSIVFILLILVSGLAWILRSSLKPLDKMVADFEEIATGNADRLNGEYAAEFVAMRDSVNNLLNVERMQRERYRNTLADLAHSLKTPLAVIQGAASEKLDYDSYLKVASEQIRRMDQIIQYQLTRAVKSIGDGAKAQPVKLVPIIERILSALGKVYREKEVRVILNLEPNIELSADERDLMEMLGNMLENAYKYCRSEIAASAYSDNDNVFIVLEDDGAGVSENLRHTILERGERADTSAAPGQGIGLSVSVDILSSYNCRLEVEDSFSLGGAKFSITFPKV